jgi:hypothetical protein
MSNLLCPDAATGAQWLHPGSYVVTIGDVLLPATVVVELHGTRKVLVEGNSGLTSLRKRMGYNTSTFE